MRFGSVCSGIEGASVAWWPLGFRPAFFSEVDPFACRLLAARFPDVPNFGDLTKWEAWSPPPIDILVGGTPCTGFSIGGTRRGLADHRSVLALHHVGLARRLRPRWFVWENVENALRTNGGRDFGALLHALGDSGYRCAWRVLDARGWGLPQRRRRVFLVGHLGDWRRAASVLLEPEGAPDHRSADEGSGEADSATAGEVGPWWNGADVAPCLDVMMLMKAQTMPERGRWCAVVDRGGPRKLTPLECERLQGFPDNWTDIPNSTDRQRWKALGDSWAVPVVRWIGERILRVDAESL